MGLYINQDSKGNPLGVTYQEKINALLNDGAIIITDHSQFIENMVCVINNFAWATVGYMYSDNERKAFTYPDGRPRTWLIYPHAKELAK